MTRTFDLLQKFQDQFEDAVATGDNKRLLVKLLRDLSLENLSDSRIHDELNKLLLLLWNDAVLLEDCILVSGFIYAKLHSDKDFEALCKLAETGKLRNQDWIELSLLGGILLRDLSSMPADSLSNLASICEAKIFNLLSAARSVLISRYIEILIQLFTAESTRTQSYDFASSGSLIISIVSQTLRLKVDIVDYKSRDLIKFHISALLSKQFITEYLAFTIEIIDCIPDSSKVALQIFDVVCSNRQIPLDSNTLSRIFNSTLPSLIIKGGTGTSAITCMAKLMGFEFDGKSQLLDQLLNEVFSYCNSRDIVRVFKSLINVMDEATVQKIKCKISEFSPNSLITLLKLIVSKTDTEFNSPEFKALLASGDEFVALECFTMLTRESTTIHRKPSEPIALDDLKLFQGFIDDTCFSGSVDFRQKVSVSAKKFYGQIFARIYHLIRELSKESDNEATTVDLKQLMDETEMIFVWIRDFVKLSLVYPFNFCKSNFGSVDFSFSQILNLFSAFSGNDTLVAANTSILSEISVKFESFVINEALLPFASKFVECVGTSSFDVLRQRATEILYKIKFDPSSIPVNLYNLDLSHPRAINNEAAARIILLHSKLSNNLDINPILSEIAGKLASLKMNFPASLQENNFNGRLLLLRFLLQEKPDISIEIAVAIVRVAIEISEFASILASHPSPEGLKVTSDDHGNAEEEGFNDDDDDFTDEDSDSSVISSQFILSFSWRAVKESSTLLEVLFRVYPDILSKDISNAVVEHFVSLLFKLRHCGAFRAIQSPLSTALRTSFTFSDKMCLLERVLKICLDTESITTTRRSAGLPFLVLAIVHSCTGRGNDLQTVLKFLIPPLVDEAQRRDETLGRKTLAQLAPSVIHSFNIIRSIVRDSRLASELGPHLAAIVDLCLKGFSSLHWSVRNASAMLLSSLIARIFGPRQINNINGQDHFVDVREIDVKYPGLLNVLSPFLSIQSDDFDSKLAYPLLAILERIKIPPQERFESFQKSILSFLKTIWWKLDSSPESGRKLIHVLGRTVNCLLSSKSLTSDSIKDELLLVDSSITPNGLYKILIILQNIKLVDPNFEFDERILPEINPQWHSILISLYNRVLSHKSTFEGNFLPLIETPDISPDSVLRNELNQEIPRIRLICHLLARNSFDREILFETVGRFKLNEEILQICLVKLCGLCVDLKDLGGLLSNLLCFYSSEERNENLRFIVLEALSNLDPSLFPAISVCIFNLLLDDDDEIRNEMCRIFNPDCPLNLAQTLRKFIDLVGRDCFVEYLSNYFEKRFKDETCASKAAILFEKEVLNLFIDIDYLSIKF